MSDDESKRDIEAEMEEADRIAREAFTRRNAEEKAASLLEYRGRDRRSARPKYVPPEFETIPEHTNASGATHGGGTIYDDVLPIPAAEFEANEPVHAIGYDGWDGFHETFRRGEPRR